MTGRIEEELDLLRTAFPDLDYRQEGGVHWVRLPSYPVPAGWTPGRVEVCFQIPAMAGPAPYAFRVRPPLARADGGQPGNYTYPVTTPWGAAWGQFSWSPVEWVPKTDIRTGANMLNFALSFANRLCEGA